MGQNNSLIDYDPMDYAHDQELDLNPMNYPNFGNYTLEQMPLDQLAKLSQQEQMRFSDAITRRYALNPTFKAQQSGFKITPQIIPQLNETSVGNMAFMAYHNPNSEWSTNYNQLIALLKK